MTVAQRTENRVDDALSPSGSAPASGAGSRAEPLAAGRQDAWDGRVDAYLEEVDRQLAAAPPPEAEPVRHLPPSEAASPSDVAPPLQAAPSGADPRAEPLPPSMAISRYEELVSERLWETQPVEATAWRRHPRSIIAGALLVLLAALAVVAFFWRTLAPSTPDNVTLRPPANERAVNPRPLQEAPTHTLARSPQSATVAAPPPVPPRTSIERTEPPAPSMIRTPAVTHTQATAGAAALPARERATPRAPKPAANCSDALTVLGLCSPDSTRGNAR
jgi:hypothetical protein